MPKISLRSLLLILPLLALGCAGGQTRSTTGGDPVPDVMGPVIHEPAVEAQPVPQVETYGPASPTGQAMETSTATSIATATSVEASPASPPGQAATSTSTGTATDTTALSSAAGTATASATATATSTATAAAGPAKLCLVLGPGMAKAMAEAAVLEVIQKAKLPVHCVVGTEMGAIVGGLFAFSNGNTNSMQWQLFKLNKENYFSFPMLSLREPRSSGRRLHDFLRGVFQAKRVEDLPIPFGTVAMDDDRDVPVEFLRGELADVLSASVAVSGIFDPWKIGRDPFRSAVGSEPAPMELARKLGGNFLVLVDVLSDGNPTKSRFHRAFTATRSLLRMQKRDASFVIQVNTDAVPFDDFSRRGEILAAGTAAAEKAMPELQAAWEKWSAGSH